jgi:hypothetical protein
LDRLQTAIQYRRRAEEFRRLGNFGIDPESMEWGRIHEKHPSQDGNSNLCPNASALLYVHAGISLSDAILVYLAGKRSTSQDHREAVRKLERECGLQKKRTDGIKHLHWLVQNKDSFAYDDQHVSLKEAAVAKTRIDRFLTWAFQTFPEIATDDHATE